MSTTVDKEQPLKDANADEEPTVTQAAAKTISGGLVVEPAADAEDSKFISQIEKTLEETKEAVLTLAEIAGDARQAKTWDNAREVVARFRPVPWFIWRLTHYVLGKPGQINPINEGLVLGLRRLLFAAASDDVLGVGNKVNNLREAIKILQPDVAAAVAVIHGVCRRFQTRPFERIWSPILDDAILRARIGFHVGSALPEFGAGRGMLAGFAGRCGLAILIGSGDLEQAQDALEMLAAGKEIREVGLEVYDCDPLQVSAMALTASGCGRDAAFGTVSYSIPTEQRTKGSQEQERWLAAFTIAEGLRLGKPGTISNSTWEEFNLSESEDRNGLTQSIRKVVRRGHGWPWML